MKKVYLLDHTYEYKLNEDVTIEETKIIGIYSSREKAEETIERYKTKKGFNRFPVDCFGFDEYKNKEIDLICI